MLSMFNGNLKVLLCFLSVFALSFSPIEINPAEIDDQPTIAFIYDSLGNRNENSWGKGGGGSWSCEPDCPDLEITHGETVTITAVANDPNNRPLEYKFEIQAIVGYSEVLQDWSSDNTYEWHSGDAYYSFHPLIVVFVRNDDDSFRFESVADYSSDDIAYAAYDVVVPGISPTLIDFAQDSSGNVINCSTTKSYSGYPCSPLINTPQIHPGEVFNIETFAYDENDLPLEYYFQTYSSDSRVNVVQQWSANKTLSIPIPEDIVLGNYVSVVAAVRNNDGFDHQGQFGDDYIDILYLVAPNYDNHVFLPLIQTGK